MMKRIVCALLAVALGISVCGFAMAEGDWSVVADTTWYNDSDTEFTLTTAEQLAGFAKLVADGTSFTGKTVKLGANIDLAGKNWSPVGYFGDNTGGSHKGFGGVFDGQKHTISNMSSIRKMAYGNAFFSRLASGAKVQNVTFTNATVQYLQDPMMSMGNVYGIVSGYVNTNVTFDNVHVKSSNLTGYGKVGILAGMSENANGTLTIQNCTVDNVKVCATYDAGGLVGLVQNSANVTDTAVTNATFTPPCYETYATSVTCIKGVRYTNLEIQDGETISDAYWWKYGKYLYGGFTNTYFLYGKSSFDNPLSSPKGMFLANSERPGKIQMTASDVTVVPGNLLVEDPVTGETTTVPQENGSHIWGEWITDKEPTETETGLRHRECTTIGCKDRQEEVIPAKGKPAPTPTAAPPAPAPKTGDSTPIALYVLCAALAVACAAWMAKRRKA